MTQDDSNRCEDEAKSQGFARVMVQDACVEWETDLKGFLLGVLKSHHLAEDAYQRTVVRAIEAAQAVRTETLRGWLFRIALNEGRLLLRQRNQDAELQASFFDQGARDQWEHQSSRGAQWISGPEIVTSEAIEAIQQSLFRLPAEQQEVIRRRIYKDQTFAQIAEQMQSPLGTVLTWMRRGLLRLKQDSQLRAFVDDSTEL